ncbi:DUF6313 family protein [Streptomyces sp. NPDC004647]|uniref:DUF6313 family protein n=1 Tax=Streptomyces sp. NPDC004647 TaxID=3154671 RepID=UPI00339E83E6
MRSLVDLHAAGGEEARFVEEFVKVPHREEWEKAIDHWERTVVFYLNQSRDLVGLSPSEALRQAEALARSALSVAARQGRCPFCK